MLAAVAAVAAVEAAVFDASPYIGVAITMIMWCGIIGLVTILGKYIVRGVAMAVTETLLSNGQTAEKVARWFTSREEVLNCLKELKEKLGDQE